MSKKNLAFALLALFVVGASFSSCKSMRKKNKCNSCPTWDHIENGDATVEFH